MNPLDLNHAKINDLLPSYNVIIDHLMYKRYNRLINEVNPLHFNKNYAQKLGFKNIVVAGNFTYSLITKWLIDFIGNPLFLKHVSVKFQRPVYINDEIIHRGKITNIFSDNNNTLIEGDFFVEKSNGELVSSGSFTISF
ncbi:MAG: MaoC family dehydratase [Candidatus Helarchaeota archaeon]